MAYNSRPKEPIQGNGWTKYQQLVLNELERHENKQEAFQEELISLRVAQTKLEVELKNTSELLRKLTTETTDAEETLTNKVSVLNKEREDLSADIKLVKWKIGAIASIFSTAITLSIQFLIKLFLHNN